MPTTSQPLVIAIDGFSSCGKSTLAKQLAADFEFVFVDSGAMYRATTLYFLQNGVDINNLNLINNSLNNIDISFKIIEGKNNTFLNGLNVETEIRSLRVSNWVSEVSAISAVRKKMVQLQREMIGTTGLIMDGRDIGTVVFPNADLKFFVTADPMVRAQRRFQELIAKDQKADLHDVISNLQHRDKIDSEREDSPLVQATDAILLDNTHLSKDEQFEFVKNIILEKMDEKIV